MKEKKIKNENATRQKIKAFLASNGYTLKEVVEKINLHYPDNQTTTQNITNKLARETIKFTEVVEIADILGYSVEFIPQKGRLYLPTTKEREEYLKEIAVKTEEDMIKIQSPNFGVTIICGTKARLAANILSTHPQLSKSEEILLHQDLRKEFDVTISVTNTHINLKG